MKLSSESLINFEQHAFQMATNWAYGHWINYKILFLIKEMKFERRVHSIVELLELKKVQLDHYPDDIKFLILFAVKIAIWVYSCSHSSSDAICHSDRVTDVSNEWTGFI